MQLNPILALELRARWRMNRSHVLLLGVALSLSVLAAFVYQSASLQSLTTSSVVSAPAARSFGGDASSVGRQLFTTLAHANIFCWLLLAVASAATGIARERERGLLESLQLSRISAPGQVRARFVSNVLLLSVLQLVLLPVYAVAVMMGGVSAPEVGAAIYLATCSAILGTSIGLWFSARSHRPTNALFGSLGVIVLLSGGLFYWIQGASFWASRSVIQWDTLWPMLLHPSGLFWALTDSTPKWSWSALEMAVGAGFIWLVASLLSLSMAARNVNRTLPVAAWQTRARWVEKLKQKQATTAPKSARAQRTSNALLADLPLDRFVRFSDPLLAREVKARFRLRRAGFWLSLVRAALFIGGASTWLFEVFWLIDKPSRGEMAPYALHALLYGGTLCLAVLAATSWTRERESGTWESLKLSLLTPRQILRAKWLSPLISFAYYSAPLWILLPIGALYIDPTAFIAGVFIVAAWLGLAVALGLWMSWRVRNGTAAIAWTAGILAMLLFGLPQINNLVGIDDTLTRWTTGVGDSREFYDAISGSIVPTKTAMAARYEAATGNKSLQPYLVTNGKTYYGYTPQFQTWGREKWEAAETFKDRLHAWQPAEALDRLFVKPETTYNNYWTRRSQLADPFSAVLWSALLPLGITMLLLLLLRRDVRREQLNA